MNAKANRLNILALGALLLIFIDTTALAGGLYINELQRYLLFRSKRQLEILKE
jgi:hypothetical protein